MIKYYTQYYFTFIYLPPFYSSIIFFDFQLYTSPELALVGLTLVPPVAFLAVSYGRFVRNITRNVQDDLARATTVAQEKISNIRTVKTFGKELVEMEKYKERLQNVLNLGYKESLARGMFFAFNGFAGNAIVISVLYYGGVMVTDQTITLGNLSAFLMYAAYIGKSHIDYNANKNRLNQIKIPSFFSLFT